jgi:hypothetical protein
MKASGWLRAILGAALLASCQLKAGPTASKVPTRSSAAASTAKPRPSATATPAGLAEGALLKPAGDFKTLSGTVQLEAAYVVGQRAGQLLSNNGAGVLELAGASGLIANNGGNIISNNAGTLISDHGGGLISDHGGGLISDHGGGIISDHGGGLIGPNGASFRLLAEAGAAGEAGVTGTAGATGEASATSTASASATPTSTPTAAATASGAASPGTTAAGAPQPGTIVPAAGMAFRAVDLQTGLPLPLGQDAQGRPAYEIVTNAQGAFEVYLPAAAVNTVRFVAAPVTGTDARLLTDDLESHPSQAVTLDEDSAQVVSYIRYTTTQGVLANVGRTPEDVLKDDVIPLLPADQKDAVITGWQALIRGMIAAKLAQRPKADQFAISQRIADLALAHVQLDQVMIRGNLLDNVGLGAFLDSSDEPAIAAIADVMKRIRSKITLAFQREADPVAYFAAQPYLVASNQRAATPFRILKPADFNDYIIRGFVANPDLDTATRYSSLVELLNSKDVKLKAPDAVRLLSGEKAIFDAVDSALYLDGAKGLADALKYLKGLPAG